MADKSPRQAMTKKTGKSIKEKRADKRADTSGAAGGSMESLSAGKKKR